MIEELPRTSVGKIRKFDLRGLGAARVGATKEPSRRGDQKIQSSVSGEERTGNEKSGTDGLPDPLALLADREANVPARP